MKRWHCNLVILMAVASALWSSGIIPAVVPAAVPPAFKQGSTGSKFQIATGSAPTAGNCATWDASQNLIDSGIGTCGGAGTSVNSFNGRTGAVLPAANDYNFNQLAGSLATSQVGAPRGNGTLVQLSTNASFTSGHGMSYDASGNAVDIGFVPASSSTSGGIYPAFTPVVDGNFAWFNQQTASYSQSNNIIYLTVPQLTGQNADLRAATAPVSTPWSITIATLPLAIRGEANAGGGLMVYDSVGGHSEGMQVDNSGTNAANAHCLSWTTLNTAAGQTSVNVLPLGVTFLKVRDDGTNLVFSMSNDGVDFTQVCSRPLSGFANTPNKVGFYVASFNAAQNISIAILSWVQGT